MENQRLLIWGTFGLMAWFAYQAWMTDYSPERQPQQQRAQLSHVVSELYLLPSAPAALESGHAQAGPR